MQRPQPPDKIFVTKLHLYVNQQEVLLLSGEASRGSVVRALEPSNQPRSQCHPFHNDLFVASGRASGQNFSHTLDKMHVTRGHAGSFIARQCATFKGF